MTSRVPWEMAAGGAAAVACGWASALITNRDLLHLATTAPVARLVSVDAFLYQAVIAAVAAPLGGASGMAFRQIAYASAVFVGSSLLAAGAASTVSGFSVGLILRSHLALATVVLALAACGALAAARIRSTLDAAGVATVVCATPIMVLLAGGSATAHLSEGAINAGLLASPLIAMTSAADIDLLRTPVLYDLAPISHRRFSYPSWQATMLAYGALAACAFSLSRKGSRC